MDAEHLELGGGLEVLLARAFERVAPGGVLEIIAEESLVYDREQNEISPSSLLACDR